MALTVSNPLDGTDGAAVSDSSLAASAVLGTVTIAGSGTRAEYDTGVLVHAHSTVLVETGHHRFGDETGEGISTPRLVASLPPAPWALRFYLYLPDLWAAGYGDEEVRWLLRLGDYGLVMYEGSSGNVNLRMQPSSGLAASWVSPSLTGTAQAQNQLLRVEITCDGTDTIASVYPGHSTAESRVHTWAGLVPSGGTVEWTAYRYRAGVLLQPGMNDANLDGTPIQDRQEQLLVWDPNILPNWGADGDYGQETTNAVIDFQTAFGLTPIDGEIGPETGAALDLMVQIEQGTAQPPPTSIGWVAVADTASEIGPAPAGVVLSPTGGIVLGGSAQTARHAMPAPSGGVLLGGSAAGSKHAVVAATGGLQMGGTAAASKSTTVGATGGIVLGGSVDTEQGTTLFIDYAAGHVSDPFEPIDDDQHIRNDVEVKREGGSSARHVQETGPLSVQPPPAGVGVYDESITLNVFDDTTLADQAAWRVHLGTIDEARYPQVRVDLSNKSFLVDDVTSRDSGDWLRVINPPKWLPPRDIDLLIQGYEERISVFTWNIIFNASDAAGYTVGEVYAPATIGGPDRADTDGARLWLDITAEQTVFDVEVYAGPPWVDSAAYPGEFPFEIVIGGEVMKVTSAEAPFGDLQTFTVTRSVNGIAMAHTAGADVRLATPAIVAL